MFPSMSFAEASGLRVNYSTLVMVPLMFENKNLNVCPEPSAAPKALFHSPTSAFLLAWPRQRWKTSYHWLTKCERWLASTSSFLSQDGRLELTNSVLSRSNFLHVHSLPNQINNKADRYFQETLSMEGAKVNARKPPKAAWTLVCKSKEEG